MLDINGVFPYRSIKSVTNDQMVEIFDYLQLPVPTHRQDKEAGEDSIDFLKLRKMFDKAVSISWNSNFPLNTNELLPEEKQAIRGVPEYEDFIQIFASKEIGFADLKPGETAFLLKDKRIEKSLINSNVLANLIVTDTELDQIIWKPEWQEYERDDYPTMKSYQENKPVKVKSKRLVNALHPEKLKAFYYAPIEVKEVKTAKKAEAPQIDLSSIAEAVRNN
jgi:hypothetical protein